jgi:capsid protein
MPLQRIEAKESLMPGPTRAWFWDGMEHVDPSKEAKAQETRLKNNTTTLALEYARIGMDWEDAIRQRAREKKLIRDLEMTEDEAAPTAREENDAV